MGELSKDMRITLLIISIALLSFAFLYIFLTDFYLELIEWPYNDPYYFRAFGIILLVFGVFGLIVNYRDDWNQAKIYLELILVWSVSILIANFIELAILPLTIGAVTNTWVDSIILIILVGATLYFFTKEKKERMRRIN
jgi:hypothetical protein